MPRYFFHTTEGGREIDEVGVELPHSRAAHTEAIRLTGALLAQEPELLIDGRDFRVEVTDGRRRIIATVVALSIDNSSPL